MTPSAEQVLARTSSVLIIDWPSRDVPDTLARAGWTVFVKGGPQPDSCSVYELAGEEVIARRIGQAPSHVDLVYFHRPLNELAGIVAQAQEVGAGVVWYQSGQSPTGAEDPRGCWVTGIESDRARALVEGAGLAYIEAPYIADAVRQMHRLE